VLLETASSAKSRQVSMAPSLREALQDHGAAYRLATRGSGPRGSSITTYGTVGSRRGFRRDSARSWCKRPRGTRILQPPWGTLTFQMMISWLWWTRTKNGRSAHSRKDDVSKMCPNGRPLDVENGR
jgi:hypothetical protein